MASLILTSVSVLFYVPLSVIGFEADCQYDVHCQMTNILSPENISNPQSILDEVAGLEGVFKGS
jgi:hypothetical protein